MRLAICIILVLICFKKNLYARNETASDRTTVQGTVYHDRNGNGRRDDGEPGVGGACVSNGKEVVRTGRDGRYELPAYERMAVTVTNPDGYAAPLNGKNVPQFFYIHQPAGSPEEIKEYAGLEPTGPLPEEINFPLVKSPMKKRFRMIITGDTQVYSDQEIDLLRKSLVREIAQQNYGAVGIICMGDNIGDKLALYPRYLSVMAELNLPLWLVPGNHDINFDAESPGYAFETFKREYGPTYYSFNRGDVHFITLNNVLYPSAREGRKTYHGEIDSVQMEWLENNLSFVPKDRLIVLSMHIPLVSYVDRKSPENMVKNRTDIYKLLEGRKVVSLGGHTHTLENHLPGEEYEGWGQVTPIRQVVVGAACGSWWSGDLDDEGVPMSYQRLGAPKGYMIWEFDGSRYESRYKAVGKSPDRQMHLSFLTPAFEAWYGKIWEWVSRDKESRSSQPPVSINDLPDQQTVSRKELDKTELVVNVWNGTRDSKVRVVFDTDTVLAKRTTEICDPYVLRLQSYVYRYSSGFEMFDGRVFGPAAPQPLEGWLHARSSSHIWVSDLPGNLEEGVHRLDVIAEGVSGETYRESLVFEVVE